jgi:hypothetical protein
MASESNGMKRKSADDGGVSPPPLRRKVQSMTTRMLRLYCPPVQMPPIYMDELTLH